MSFTFNVYRREKGDVNPATMITTGLTSKNFTDDTVEQDKFYLYSVAATDGVVEKHSEEVEVSTHSIAPIVVGTTASSFTISTSQTKVIPSGTQAGDLIVAFVMHRDVLTVPSGWVLVSRAEAATSTGIQYCSVYSKIATLIDIDVNVTFSQATNLRFSLALMSFRHERGCKIVDIVGSDYISQFDAKIDFTSFVASRNGVALNFGSWAYATTDISTTYSASAGYVSAPMTSTSDTENQVRSGIGYKQIDYHAVNSGYFSIINSNDSFANRTTNACSIGFLVTYV